MGHLPQALSSDGTAAVTNPGTGLRIREPYQLLVLILKARAKMQLGCMHTEVLAMANAQLGKCVSYAS